MQVTAGVRSTGSRRGGFISAATAVVAGITLSACNGAAPQSVAASFPTTQQTTLATTGAVVAGSTEPIPTVTADPLTPTKPTPTTPTPASTTPAATTPAATTPAATTPAATTPAATTAAVTPAAVTTAAPAPTPDPAGVAGSCERTLPAYPVLEPGAEGPAVRTLQCFLDDAGYGPVAVAGVYGAHTRAAVKRAEAGLEGPPPHPGRIDAGMWVLVISRTLGTGTLTVGAKGAEVVTLQRALRAAGGTIAVDGTFGAETKAVVQRFQRANRVGDDGVVGDETLFLLRRGATIG